MANQLNLVYQEWNHHIASLPLASLGNQAGVFLRNPAALSLPLIKP